MAWITGQMQLTQRSGDTVSSVTESRNYRCPGRQQVQTKPSLVTRTSNYRCPGRYQICLVEYKDELLVWLFFTQIFLNVL